MQLELTVESDSSPSLRANGEIFVYPVASTGKPLFAISARPGWPASFQLPDGKYQLEFYVKYGAGKFIIKVSEYGKTTPLAKEEYDTAFGFLGKSLAFEVKP